MARKRKKRRIRLSHIVLLSILIYILLIFRNQNKLKRELEAKRDLVQSEIDELNKDIDELNKEIEASDSLQFVEKIARDDLGMVKPREIIYIDKNKKKNPFLKIRKADN